MFIKNIKIVTLNKVIDNGFIEIENGIIKNIYDYPFNLNEPAIDGKNNIAFPGFIDVHIHGSMGVDFMNSTKDEMVKGANSLYQEGVTSFLVTTLTSDTDSLVKVSKTVVEAKKEAKNIFGIHLEGPYISLKYIGAQNPNYVRNADINELKLLIEKSNNNIKYITLAPEKENAMDFIEYCKNQGIVTSAGHSDATFEEVEEAIKHGLTNTTHTHNAMSPHHHRRPGVVTAAMYFDELYTELICDFIHVSKNTVKTFYKIVGPDRFMIITDALSAKHSDLDHIKLFGLDCEKKNGALYLTTGPLAGSLLSMDQGMRNLKEATNCSLIDLMKASSYNQSKSLHLTDRGLLEKGRIADIVLMDNNLKVKEVYKLGELVYHD